jgi:ABC-type sugar transport system ATPase subunit
MTVRKNVESGLKMRGMEVSDIEVAVDKVLDLARAKGC